MKLRKWAFIYMGTGTEDPMADRAVIERGGLQTTIVVVPEPSRALQIAVELVNDGAQPIELCGVFGPVWTSRIMEATGGRVPIGSVSYGLEFASALARFTSAGSE
ncbi:DUF6506 family protein [Paenibacillus spongiae]|uniref:DUF6506 family protein n=1 Tax=Paenibacillus spongiae TaxID=2909671 RepID=A0ABY5SBF6_9BACL|nr:DUF6506 family protein [Paenibacillus spongiae]UVI31084.1 DUF6506 family protein [Paenibacillus spongiae]